MFSDEKDTATHLVSCHPYKTRLFLNMSEEDTETTTTTTTTTPNEVEEKTAGEDEAPKEEESTATFEPVVRFLVGRSVGST